MQGGSEVTLSAHATLTSTTTKQVWARPPIDVDFQVLMFTASGLIVRFLKVFEKSSYQSVKWVRYLTKASGSYQIRVSNLTCLEEETALITPLGLVLRHIYSHVSHPQSHLVATKCFMSLFIFRVQASHGILYPPLWLLVDRNAIQVTSGESDITPPGLTAP